MHKKQLADYKQKTSKYNIDIMLPVSEADISHTTTYQQTKPAAANRTHVVLPAISRDPRL